MTYIRPGVQTSTGGAVPGGGTVTGQVIALFGSAPQGPASPKLVTNKVDALGIFGDDMFYNDFQGWTIPEALRIIYENDFGLTPQVLVCRCGVAQALIVLGNQGATTGTWTATAVPQTLGGSSGNGITLQYSVAGSGTLTITPPPTAPVSVNTEVYTNLGATATWAAIANVVNARSQLVNLTLTGADQPALAGTILNTTAAGTDGANASAAAINTTMDALMQMTYGQQPINYLVPLFPDTATSGVTLHALTDAVAMLANGSYQRTQVIGSAAQGLTVSQLTTIGSALVPTENGGDSGRCSFFGNALPWRTDPATGLSRLYPGWILSSAYAGACSSLPPATPRGRLKLNGIDRVADGFSISDQNTLLGAGVQAIQPTGRLIDQVTTASPTSYRREQNVQTQEDVWTGMLQWYINTVAIETASGTQGGQYLDNLVGLNLLGYMEQNLMASSTHNTHMSTTDSRSWEVDVSWVPLLPLRNVTLRTYLANPPAASASAIATF